MIEQLCFFPDAGQSKRLTKDILEYQPGLVDLQTSDRLLEKFISSTTMGLCLFSLPCGNSTIIVPMSLMPLPAMRDRLYLIF